MTHRWSRLAFTTTLTVLMLLLARLSLQPAAMQPACPIDCTAKISAELHPVLTNTQPLPIVIYLSEQADLSTTSLPSRATRADRAAAVIDQLQTVADESQPAVAALLANKRAENVRRFWIVNAIAAQVSAETIPTLAALPTVAAIDLDTQIARDPASQLPLPNTSNSPANFATPTYNTPWGLQLANADKANRLLNLDGSGIVIAGMDTGVDGTHPELRDSYRGNQLGHNHADSWFDATVSNPISSPVPIDPVWHGTHTIASAVGASTGVAPGASWIGVRIFNAVGFASESGILSGFQWLIAPNGNPANAPHILNNSWGSDGFFTGWQASIDALHAAGIMTVNSVGNQGREENGLNAPASYANTLSVGATDLRDKTAWFSSRGPSPITAVQNPSLVAPGTRILSAFPANRYAAASGTSMAAPHVAGTLALMLQANPTLDYATATRILTQTAATIDPTHPNNDSGWGRLDAYAAASLALDEGPFSAPRTAVIALRANGAAVAEAAVTIENVASGQAVVFLSDQDGIVTAPLALGQYVISAEKVGHLSASQSVEVDRGPSQLVALNLTRLPHGSVQGQVQSSAGTPLTATVTLLETGQQYRADSSGSVQFSLPTGSYTARITHPAYRSQTATLNVVANAPATFNATLSTGPNILLIDGAGWQYDSQAAYYRDALHAAAYSFTEWAVYDPFFDEPTAADLAPYDIVIWADHLWSPGTVNGDLPLTQFMQDGGNVLIAGQRAGELDSNAFLANWWHFHLRGLHQGRTSAENSVQGAPDSDFAGLTLQFNGPDSAANHPSIERSNARLSGLSDPLLQHPDGSAAAISARRCRDYNLIYFGFGLEGVRGANTRQTLVERSIDHLLAPPVERGLRFETDPIDDFILPSQTLTHTLRVRNLSETITDTVTFSINAPWTSSVVSQTVTLGPCGAADIPVTITAPDNFDTTTVSRATVRAVMPGASAEITLTHRGPQNVLFVDDELFFDNDHVFRERLDAHSIPYDYWDVGGLTGQRGPISAELLLNYDIVFWSTGYDWFQPILPEESAALLSFMQQGGRLFLSSQDYLAYHADDPFSHQFLGVASYTESLPINTAFMPTLPATPLNYSEYRQFSDGVVPYPAATPIAWSNSGLPAALRNADADWRTEFWAVPLELLATDSAEVAFDEAIAYLSDLGDTQFVVDQPTAPVGSVRTFTLTIRPIPNAPVSTVTLTNTLPAGLMLDPTSVQGAAVSGQTLRWQGSLAGGDMHHIVYRATVNGGTDQAIENNATLHYDHHNYTLKKRVALTVGGPDLHDSRLTAQHTQRGEPVTYTLTVTNRATAGPITATLILPLETQPVTDTLTASLNSAELLTKTVRWHGVLAQNASVVVSIVVTSAVSAETLHAGALAVLDSGHPYPTLLPLVTPIHAPYRLYLPITHR